MPPVCLYAPLSLKSKSIPPPTLRTIYRGGDEPEYERNDAVYHEIEYPHHEEHDKAYNAPAERVYLAVGCHHAQNHQYAQDDHEHDS